MAKVYLEVHGCSASLNDGELVRGLLQLEHQLVEDPKEADANIIITCTVKEPTEHRMVHRIRELERLGRPLVVAGCLPKANRELVERISPNACLLGPQAIDRAPEVLEAALQGRKLVRLEDSPRPKLLLPKARANRVIEVVQIATGCLSACSFCQTKLAKGSLKSYPPEMIVEQVKRALEEGCKEIWLTSTDNGPYGFDLGTNLAELLRTLTRLNGEFRLRVGMMNPLFVKRYLEELIEAYSDHRIFKFLHLPVQSGSDAILKAMLRGHSASDFLEIVEAFRSHYPRITVSTDIIVGFPGEGEEDFMATLELLERVEPDIVHISRFGPRPGTLASSLPRLDPKLVAERSARLHRLVRQIARRRNELWRGWEGEVLVDEEVERGVMGRNFAYRPIFLPMSCALGDFARVRVVGCSTASLIGELVNSP